MKRSTYIKCCVPMVILVVYQLMFMYKFNTIMSYNVFSNILIAASIIFAYSGASVLYNHLDCKYKLQFFLFEIIALIASVITTIYLGYHTRYIISIVCALVVIINLLWYMGITKSKSVKS